MRTPPSVRTSTGSVRGSWAGPVAVFRGVPFAAPPVGKDRFAPPRAASSWDGVRDAVEFGPGLPPAGLPGGGVPDGDDWLTLAVWTPEPGAVGLPVVVWISGGAYLRCDTASPHQDGALLAAGGVVVISVNYRTGAEGFAHLAGAPDNRGLLDQLAALRWVQENVAAFGGDPARVTVFGESAGAGSIAALLVMPSAVGLFHRASLQSIPATYFSTALAADIAAVVAAEVGRGPRADQLVDVAPAALAAADAAVTERLAHTEERWGPVAHSSTPYSPVVDGEVLSAAPWSALPSGAGGVDLLVAHVRNEFRMLAEHLFPGPTSDADADAQIERLLPSGARGYRTTFPGASGAQRLELAMADWLMRMPTIRFADAAARGGARVWTSELTWGFGPRGATHGLDTLLVFGTTDITGEVTDQGPAVVHQERELSALMRAELLSFVESGAPGWSRYEPEELTTRVYDAPPSVRRYPEEPSRRLWRDHRFEVLDLP